MDDMQLIQAYVHEHSQEAFAKLVSRHVDWVYSTCLRLVRDPHLAEDVSQAVFIALARKAPDLPRDTHLSGWLFRACQYCAANARHKELIRRGHERKAAAMRSEIPQQPDASWSEVADALDSGVAAMGDADRRVLLLRFYEGRDTREMGEALGINEDAARQRLSRAIGKLRNWLGRRGVRVSVAALASLMAVETVHAAPAHLAATITAGALAAGAGAGATLASASIAKGALQMMAWAKLKIAASVIAAALLVAAMSIAFAIKAASRSNSTTSAGSSAAASTASANIANTQSPSGSAQSGSAPRAASIRTIDFAPNRPLGDLWIQADVNPRSFDDFDPARPDTAGWRFLGRAEGHVSIPAGMRLALRITPRAAADLSPLARLAPTDLYQISFQSPPPGTPRATTAGLQHLAALTGLRVLDLRNTTITAADLQSLANLTSLQYLHLPPTIGDDVVNQVSQIPSLRGVYLCPANGTTPAGDASLTPAGIARIAALPALEELALGGPALTASTLSTLSSTRNLKCLMLWGSDLGDPALEPLRRVSSLRVLYLSDLSNIGETGLGYVAALPALEVLRTSGIPIGDAGLLRLSPLATLRSLHIGASSSLSGFITDDGLLQLQQFARLESLSIESGAFTDAGMASLAQLPRLQRLCLHPTAAAGAIGDKGVEHLARLQSLRELELIAEDMTDKGAASLAQLPSLWRLSLLRRSRITNDGLYRLTASRSIEHLSIAGSRISITGLSLLSRMPQLQSIALTGIAPGDGQLDFSALDKLESLTLECPLDDLDLAGLIALKNLRVLSLEASAPDHGRRITRIGLAHAALLPNLETLSLRATQLNLDALAGLSGSRIRELHLTGPIPSTALRTLDLPNLQTGTGAFSAEEK